MKEGKGKKDQFYVCLVSIKETFILFMMDSLYQRDFFIEKEQATFI